MVLTSDKSNKAILGIAAFNVSDRKLTGNSCA